MNPQTPTHKMNEKEIVAYGKFNLEVGRTEMLKEVKKIIHNLKCQECGEITCPVPQINRMEFIEQLEKLNK